MVLRGAEGILRFGGDVRRDLGPSLALNGIDFKGTGLLSAWSPRVQCCTAWRGEMRDVQVIIVDWLYREVDGLAEIKMPVLQYIAGHRNREVYEYLELTHDVRDSRAAAIYSA